EIYTNTESSAASDVYKRQAQGYVQPKFNFGKLAIGQPASLSAPRWEPGHGEVFPGIVERLEDDE
ncbi:hypothetical protein ACM9NK_30675, partial [Pseudomonas paraeruginosa]